MVTEIVVGLALLIYRQLRTRPVNASGLRIVAIIAVIGLGYDALVAGPGQDNVGAATIVLYLAVSLAIQRAIVRLRAQRLQSRSVQNSDRLGTLGT